MYSIVNLTNPGQPPVDGDLVLIDGKIEKIYREDPVDGDLVLIDGKIEKIYREDPVIDPNDEEHMTILIEASASTIAVGQSFDIDAICRVQSGDLSDLATTFYVPIIGIDGAQQDLVVLTFAAGIASVTYTPTKAGIYHAALDMARPAPLQRIINLSEVIVTPV